MKICFFAPFAYGLFYPESKQQFGGAEVQFFQLAEELAKDDSLEISFILADFGQQVERRGSLQLLRSFRAKPNNKAAYIFAFILAPFQIWRALGQADADVYVQRGASAETGIIALYCKLYKKKFVYMVAHERECGGEYMKQRRARGILFRYGLHHADIVLTQHKNQKNMFARYENIESQIFPTVFPVPEKILPPEERQYILWVGRLVEWKQPELMLELASVFPEDKIVVIGDGQSSYAARIKEKCNNMQNIQYMRHVPFLEISQYFQRAKLFINTSQSEGFPNTFIQALQYGVPIVSLNVDPGAFLGREKCGYCAKGDIAEIRRKISLLMSNNELYSETSRKCRSYFERAHEISAHINELKNLFQRVAG